MRKVSSRRIDKGTVIAYSQVQTHAIAFDNKIVCIEVHFLNGGIGKGKRRISGCSIRL